MALEVIILNLYFILNPSPVLSNIAATVHFGLEYVTSPNWEELCHALSILKSSPEKNVTKIINSSSDCLYKWW